MATIRLKYVASETSRHGTPFHYFRRRGQSKIRLPGLPGSDDFMAAYRAALAGRPLPEIVKAAPAVKPITDRRSFSWLCQQYIHSPQFATLDEVKTRRPRVAILNAICAMPIGDGAKSPKVGDAPFAEMPSRVVRRIRDRKADTPASANVWLKTLKALFKWATEEEYATNNPTTGVTRLKEGRDGFHTWTPEEVAIWEAFYPIGTVQRLACALMLYTGCRRSDAIAFGPGHVKDGWLTYVQHKNRKSNPSKLAVPVLAPLAEIIAATPTGETFLLSTDNRPYKVDNFKAHFKAWATAAGIPHCTPHGLRKAGAVRCAEAGATAAELMAIFGWRDINMTERYTRSAAQKKLAGKGMERLA